MRIAALTSLIFLLTLPVVAKISDTSLNPEEKKLIEEGKILVRELPTLQKEGRAFRAIGLISADVDEIYQTLKDFDAYPEFMPNLEEIEVLERDGNTVILNYTLDLPLNKVKKYRLSSHYKMEEDSAVITWEMIPWPGLKESEKIEDTTGFWKLRKYPDKKGHTLAVYHVYTDPGPIPVGLGWIVNILTESGVPDVVINTRERVHELYRHQ